MFDAHRHLAGYEDDRIPDGWKAVLVTSGPLHWPDMLSHMEQGNICASAGLIPQGFPPSVETIRKAYDTLASLLQNHPLLAVGEIGLDDRYARRIPMELQIEICTSLLSLATDLGRPVSFHAVRSDGLLIGIIRKIKPKVPMLWHSFLGSVETAKELSRLGCMISISPSIWRAGTKLQQRIPEIDVPFVLETDFPHHYRLPGEPVLPYRDVFTRHLQRYALAFGCKDHELEERCDGFAPLFTDHQTARA